MNSDIADSSSSGGSKLSLDTVLENSGPGTKNSNKLDSLFAARTEARTEAKSEAEAGEDWSFGATNFKSKLESLREMLADDGLNLDILKLSLRQLKEHIQEDPNIVVEMLPEEIGLLTEALLRTEQIRIIAETKSKSKRGKKSTGVKRLSSEEIEELNQGKLEF